MNSSHKSGGAKKLINPTKIAALRRNEILNQGRLLLANLTVGEQVKDIQETKGNVKGAIEDFFRVKTNVKTEAWSAYLRTGDSQETRDPRLLMFDFDWWPIPKMGGKPEDWNEVYIYQLKGCNVACPFCFVDRCNNDGKDRDGAKYFTTKGIVDAFTHTREDKLRQGVSINVLRASGGEPSLVPEQWLWTLQELKSRGLSDKVYFQSDTNLTTGTALRQWMDQGKLSRNILDDVAEYGNFGLLSCFKGTDPATFAQNSGCDASAFDEQFESYRLFIRAGVKTYPHVVNPNPDTLESFMDRLAKEHGDQMYGMVHIFSIGMYGPVKDRIQKRGTDADKAAAQWRDNYAKGVEVMDRLCQKHLGVGYKRTSRPDTIESIVYC